MQLDVAAHVVDAGGVTGGLDLPKDRLRGAGQVLAHLHGVPPRVYGVVWARCFSKFARYVSGRKPWQGMNWRVRMPPQRSEE